MSSEPSTFSSADAVADGSVNDDAVDVAPASAQSVRDAVQTSGTRSLLQTVIHATTTGRVDSQVATATTGFLDRFLNEPSLAKSIALWIGANVPRSKAKLARSLSRDIALLDTLLSDQLNAIIHHPRFQKIEASWHGLRYLVDQVQEGSNVRIRALNVSWKELARDAEHAIEFDQSQLFRKVYSEEFGSPGGVPFSVLVGDYEIRPGLDRRHPIDDIATLRSISQVAAAAFAPFVAAAHPAMFGLEDFSGLERSINLERVFSQNEYLPWRSFRQEEDSRFVGLVAPRVLWRLPYDDNNARVDGFRFEEDLAEPKGTRYLWGNAAYAFGAVLVRAFAESGWLADIRGVRRGFESGGLVTGLPVHSFATDKHNLIQKSSTDVVVTDMLEKTLSELGFVPLCHCKDTEFSAFYSNASVQKPKVYDRPAATANARISAMLQYMLCVSRFSHYLKVIARDKIGTFGEARDCESYLTNWLTRYVNPDASASTDVKARYPLREAKVLVRESRAAPGKYNCVIHLWPHYELDDLTASIRVRSELAPPEQ